MTEEFPFEPEPSGEDEVGVEQTAGQRRRRGFEAPEVEVGVDIAVDHQERSVAKQRYCVGNPSASLQRRLLPPDTQRIIVFWSVFE